MERPERFSVIETRATLRDGRQISSWKSYPQGVGLTEYRRADAEAVRAFGSDGTMTIGTPLIRN